MAVITNAADVRGSAMHHTTQPDAKAEQAAIVRVCGKRLREARELCNMTQQTAARRLGYANSSPLSKIEGAVDTVAVSLWVIVRAARLYEVTTDFLLGVESDYDHDPHAIATRRAGFYLLGAWESARLQDLARIDRLSKEIATVSTAVTVLSGLVGEVDAALARFRVLNPSDGDLAGFDDLPGSAALESTVARSRDAADRAKNMLRRFNLHCQASAAGNRQLQLALADDAG